MVSIRTTQKKCYNDFFSEHAEYLLFFLIDLPPPNSLEGDISSKKVLFFYGPTIQKKNLLCVSSLSGYGVLNLPNIAV